ncbi:hypothetical protein O3G_MSEX009866 [Manduca sexta]|uniref:Uncharacterized protein n=1 Tax=Manduca sexta TaxID=7130 RepID=A0A921ZFN1_MANSE|nr:hypothetical protein O3G_MSEX009866 [Manduca sexta]
MASMKHIMLDPERRGPLLDYFDKIFRRTTARTTKLTKSGQLTNTITPTNNPIITLTQTLNSYTPEPKRDLDSRQLLNLAEIGTPGIRLRSVATFMDNHSEKLGIIVGARKHIAIAPGLACLLKGSTSRTSMKRKDYLALPEMELYPRKCRLVRARNKTIALLEWSDEDPFRQACSVLSEMAREGEQAQTTPRKISVDAMVVEYERGNVSDQLSCLYASKHHEVIVYENRGENLNYLIAAKKSEALPTSEATVKSWSESLQQKIAESKAEKTNPKGDATPSAFIKGATKILKNILKIPTNTEITPDYTLLPPPKPTETSSRRNKTRADKGEVVPPKLLPASEPRSHTYNAFLEFIAITKATLQVNTNICKKILQAYKYNSKILDVLLKEEEAAIYDNSTSEVILGKLEGPYMAAYNATSGFVASEEAESERKGNPHFNTPPQDSIVVTARCTRIMLDDRILAMADTITGNLVANAVPDNCTVPVFQWVNGVPGCGKTTWVVNTSMRKLTSSPQQQWKLPEN